MDVISSTFTVDRNGRKITRFFKESGNLSQSRVVTAVVRKPLSYYLSVFGGVPCTSSGYKRFIREALSVGYSRDDIIRFIGSE